MDTVSSPRSPWALTFAIILGFTVALVIGGADLYFKTPLLEHGDAAVNALQIDNARHGSEIYGNYSRFQFNHPGPAFFYTYAAGEIVLKDWLGLVPTPHNAHLLASLFVQTCCFALAVGLVHCWIGSWTFVALALLGGVWHFSLARFAFTSIWPPHVLLMPFLAFIASACSFAAGRRWDLLLMVLTGGFLFHGHVAQPLFVGGIGSLALFLHYRQLKRTAEWTGLKPWWRANRRLLACCGGLIFLFLLPLLIDVVCYGLRGNISTIFRRVLLNTEESKGLIQSLLYFLSFPTYADNQEDLFSKLGPESYQFFRDHLPILGAWAVFVILPAAFAYWRWKKLPLPAQQFLGGAYLIIGCTFFLCIVWGKMQAGPMVQFNGYFYHGVYYFLGLLSIGVICSIPGRLLPVPVTAAICGVAGISASWMFRAPRLGADESGMTIRKGVEAALQADTSRRPKLVVFEHYAWPEAASVVLELQRRGIPFYVSPTWNFMFGRRHSLRLLGAHPEEASDIWWITEPGPDGIPINSNLQLFTHPAVLDPQDAAVSFAGKAGGFRYLVHGLSVGNVEFAWTDDQRIALKFQAAQATGDVKVTFDTNIHMRAQSPLVQPAEVFFDGRSLGIISVSKHEEQAIVIPGPLWNAASVPVLELRFPAAVYTSSFSLPANETWSAIALFGVHFRVIPAN